MLQYAQALPFTLTFLYDSDKFDSLLFSINTVLIEIQINLFKIWKQIYFVNYLHPLLTHVSKPMMPYPIEAKEIEESVLPVHKYNVPTFSPFYITNDPLMTFHVLYVNMDI